MSGKNRDLIDLLDSILQQVPNDLTVSKAKSIAVDDSFDKVRTLDILINSVLVSFINSSDEQDISTLIKVFKTVQLLVQQNYIILVENEPLKFDKVIPKLLPFLGHHEEIIVNETKLTIITVVETLCDKIHSYKFIKQIGTFLLTYLDQLSTTLFQSIPQLHGPHDLAITIHLLQLLQDYKLNHLLLFDQLDFKLDSIVRSAWYCVSQYSLQQHKVHLVGDLSSVLLLSMFSSYIKDSVPITSKLVFLCDKVSELINWKNLSQLPRLQSTITKVVLELSFNGLQLHNFVSMATRLRVHSSVVLESLKADRHQVYELGLIKSLCLVSYVTDRLKGEELEEVVDPDTTMGNAEQAFQDTMTKFAISVYTDAELEKMRVSILGQLIDKQLNLGSLLPLTDGTKLIELNISAIEDLHSFINHIDQIYATTPSSLTGVSKLYIIRSLGSIACIKSGEYDTQSKLCPRCDLQLNDSTYVNNSVDPRRPECGADPVIMRVLQTLTKLIEFEAQDPVLVIEILLALRKIFASYQPPALSRTDPIYRFLSACLVHDIREVRMLTSKLMPYYLILDDNDEVYESNFQIIIASLQQIKINKKLHLAESTVVAWSELAIVIGIDEKLILVLVKLIDFIGSENQFQSTIAFHQLHIISSCKRKTPWQLLSPFLPHLSIVIVKQMKSKPMIINKICGLVRVPLDVFLTRTQTYTIPHVLTYYKHDLIGEISNTIKVTKYELIKRNFPKIIAYLLTVEDKINEAKIIQILSNVNDEFKNRSLQELIENNILTSWEILKLYSPEFNNQERIKNALLFIASMYATSDNYTSRDKLLQNYLNRTILGIVQNFSESTYDLKGLQPYIEKLRSIWAIESLILISGKDIVAALPQITACLQANLEIKHLHLESLHCLEILTRNLDRQTMIVMLDFILSLILQKWDQFNKKCKEKCQQILSYVMKNNEAIFKQRYYHYFFSFSFNPELLRIYNDARVLFPTSTKSSSYNLLHDLTIRCNHDNKFVVLQALDDLIHYFTKYQDEFHSNYVKLPTFIKYIPKLGSTLLNISYKFKNSDSNIVSKCSVIYGLMGSLDFNRFYLSTDEEHEQLVVINLFQDQNEVYRFLINFINITLVPAFWASIDPVKQLFLAYALQEYMKLLNLNGVDIQSIDKNSTSYIIWNKFSRISQSTLIPLLNSKYSVNGSKDESAVYPIYKNYIKHSNWLRELTLDLLKKSKRNIGVNKNGEKIFNICSSIIKDQDLAICNYILPYVALNCVLVSESIREEISLEVLTILKTDVDTLNDNAGVESLKSCYQSVFSILEYFQKWASARKQKRKRQESSAKINEMTQRIEEFLEEIPQDLIAKRSSQCKSYERAILNLEESYRSSTIDNREFFSTIQSMYVEIDDLDSLDGVLKTFSTQSLNDKLLQFQYSDDWKIAQDCFEALSEFDVENESLESTTSLLKSLNKFNLYDNCLEKLDHILAKATDKEDSIPLEWVNLGLNSAVFAAKLDEIIKWIYYFECNIDTSSLNDAKILVNYEVAKALVALNSGRITPACDHIDHAIKLAGDSLAASKETSLSKTRDIVTQLHWLTEAKLFISASTQTKFNSVINTADVRLSNTSKDFQSNWQILTIRRVLDKLHPNKFSKADISNVWVKLAAIARESSRLDLSTKAIMNALVLQNSKEVDLEYAQLLWAQDDHSRALKAIDELRLKNTGAIALNREAAKIQLIYTEWLDLSDSGSSELIVEEYTAAAKLDTKWEKPYYCLGKYYNKILENQDVLNDDIKTSKDYYGDYEKGLVFNYLRAIKTGHTYLFEALPKVITIWLDFSTRYDVIPAGFNSEDLAIKRRKNFELMKQCVKDVIDSTPKVYWYTVLSQLTSRMIHNNTEIQKIIINLISKITYEYPQQALWSVIAQSKSTLKSRATLGASMLNIVAGYDKDKSRSILKSALALFDSLLSVCMQEVNKKTSEMHLKDDFGFDHAITPCDSLCVPLRENFEIRFPSSVENKRYSNYSIGSKITIHRIDDRVRILTSMQKPRRLSIRGSDGGIYSILCKPHDDLRKDAKLMEVTTMIDKLLERDEESELRKLSIATYAVVPLNETYGIIEWVDRCRTMRDIVLTYLSSTGNPIDLGYCKKALSEEKSEEEKTQGFNAILAKYPPVFRLWFLEEFPDPKSWYTARNNFTRSSAVMSIVGHILGLGDRHGDNILMMERTGGVLHVDFDCLFDKGATLAVPERVPFRLTANMVDAFGIVGVEGIFRKSCEVTTRLIRNNETGLMNILESFLYDPILDWSVSKRRRRDKDAAGHNPQTVLNNIKKKIRGIEKDTSLSLSVGANVDMLIAQARSVENLAMMYIGWMSFL